MIPSQVPPHNIPISSSNEEAVVMSARDYFNKNRGATCNDAIEALERRGFESKSAKRAVFQVFQGILERWVDEYGPQDREAAIAYARSRLHRDFYIKKKNFKEGLDAFFKIYLEIPVQYRNTSLELLHFDLFEDLKSVFSDPFVAETFVSLMEKKTGHKEFDTFIEPEDIVTEKTEQKLFDTFQKLNKNGGGSFDQLKLMQDMPKDWLEKMIAGSLPFPPERHNNLVELLRQSTNQIDLIYRCKLGKPYIPGEGQEEYPLELCMADAHRYPLKRSLFTEAFLYGDQALYGQLMHQSVLMGSSLLKKGVNFEELLYFLSARRNEIALQLNQQEKHRFGIFLCPGDYGNTHTPCSNDTPYGALGQELENELKMETPYAKLVKENLYQLQAPFAINGFSSEPLPHSKIDLNHGEWCYDKTFFYKYSREIYHTSDHKVRRDILYRVAALIENARKEPSNALFLEKMGLAFWWICQAKPWERGDPSIAEILIKSYCMERGINLPPWKAGIVPWEEVMKTFNPLTFAEHFHELFEQR